MWLKEKWWLLSLGWIALYLLSFFWSDDKPAAAARVEIKLVIIFFPLAFAMLPAFTAKQLKILTASTCTLLLFSIGYSLSFLIRDYEYYIWRYYMSNVLPVLAKKDHIRYSLTLSLFSVWCMYFWPNLKELWLRIFVGISVAIFIVFLHILAVRTGLLSFYIFVFVMIVAFGLRKSKVLAIVISAVLLATVYLLVMNVPTLKKKRDYFFYSIERYNEGDRSGHYSDIGRLMSYSLGWQLIKEHPVLGVGSGDLMTEMTAKYKDWYPEVDQEKVLIPHNQFMVIALAAGISAMLLFVIWVFAPLTLVKKGRNGRYFFCVWLMLFAPLLVEPLLEVQFGVFVYLFFLLLQKHMLKHSAGRNDFITSNSSNDQLHTHISA